MKFFDLGDRLVKSPGDLKPWELDAYHAAIEALSEPYEGNPTGVWGYSGTADRLAYLPQAIAVGVTPSRLEAVVESVPLSQRYDYFHTSLIGPGHNGLELLWRRVSNIKTVPPAPTRPIPLPGPIYEIGPMLERWTHESVRHDGTFVDPTMRAANREKLMTLPTPKAWADVDADLFTYLVEANLALPYPNPAAFSPGSLPDFDTPLDLRGWLIFESVKGQPSG